jgi:hypothetical protein
MHRTVFALFIGFFLLPAFSHAEELNAGFVEGLWYGSETVIAGEPTRIYIALRNNTENDLTGTVRFSDNGNRIGVSYVSALPGRLVEAWVDWKPLYGEHTITATLSDVRVYEIGQTPETGEIEDPIAQGTIFVDYDTDKDGVPNKTDTDDDNDTVSDADEETRGTDPLKANPIAKDEDDDSETNEKEKNETDVDTKKSPEKPTRQSGPGPRGLEQYVPQETVQNVVETVTDTINETKTSLDAYREKRTDIVRGFMDGSNTTTINDNGSATITRTRIESEESFLTAVIEGGKAFVSGVYSFILWILSNTLAHPALLELALLLFIIILIYRTARRFGRRRKNNDRL